jgi:hypothetical protein
MRGPRRVPITILAAMTGIDRTYLHEIMRITASGWRC